MSEAIKVRSFEERRAEIEALKERLVADAVKALDICYEVRDQALAIGDEPLAWKACSEAAAIVAANRDARASLDRFLGHIEAAAKS